MTLERRTPMKRSPMKRTARQLARSPIKPKRKVLDNEFTAAVKAEAWRRAGGHCEFPDCSRTTWIVYHHRWQRGKGGPGTLGNCMVLCTPHHEHVHSHGTESYERGWLLRGGA